jgi:signal transduction histidine kinase
MPGGQRLRLMVVDGDAERRVHLRGLLLNGCDREHDWLECGTGTEALRAFHEINQSPPDCVLLNHQLPDMRATDVLAAVGTLNGFPPCPIIVLCEDAGASFGRDVIQAGAQDYIGQEWLTPNALHRAIENAGDRWAVARELVDRNRDAEARIQRLNAELEDRVKQRTVQLEAANKELEAFSYSVSHDLRAPVRAIDGFSRILQEDFSANLPDAAKDFLKEISDNSKYMGRLIDDLLNFSRLGRQALRIATVPTESLVRQCIDSLGGDVCAEFRIARLPHCYGDVSLIRQVWINLLGNAVKYSRRSTPPIIEVACSDSDQDVVYFIKDNGVGFDMRYVHKLFGVFQRLHRQEDYEGTGVGLAVVQRIIHRHGGRVWAESKPGEGATFYFSLPLEGAAA